MGIKNLNINLKNETISNILKGEQENRDNNKHPYHRKRLANEINVLMKKLSAKSERRYGTYKSR